MSKTGLSERQKALLYELARLGSPVDLSVAVTEVEKERVEIEQVGGIHESRLFELQDGRFACMADIAVTNQTARTIDLVDVEMRASWDDSVFEWLKPLQVKSQAGAKRGRRHAVYQFPRDCGPQWEYGEVINHHLVELRKLPGKRRLEGLLLGIGGLMPAGLRHGQWLDMHLTIIGSDHTEYATTIRLWTERLPARAKIVKAREMRLRKPIGTGNMPALTDLAPELLGRHEHLAASSTNRVPSRARRGTGEGGHRSLGKGSEKHKLRREG
jgi:hypothetical protein